MGLNDDFIDPLVEEILTDVAGSFFETRRQLDEKIDLFHSYAQALRRKETEVRDPAAHSSFILRKGLAKRQPAPVAGGRTAAWWSCT